MINYNSTANYAGGGAFGERVTPDNIAASASPDAVGTRAAYFVGDRSVNETIYQDIFLAPGNYRVGFSYYLTANGLRNIGNSSIDATIIGIPVASTAITSTSIAKQWRAVSGVGQISRAGYYDTAFVFNSNRTPSKDIVIDRVFAIRTLDNPEIIIPPTPTAVPEPAMWMMYITGFGLVGTVIRRRARSGVRKVY